MTWVGYLEDIEQSQIEALEKEGRHLQIVAARARPNNDESKRYLEYAKLYHKAAKDYHNSALGIIKYAQYSKALLVKNKELQNELSDRNRVILELREELQKVIKKKTSYDQSCKTEFKKIHTIFTNRTS
ncbi:MAG: hypothetical protein ACYDHG_14910 [Desulfomonilaceae bacterium]